jgi:LAS superfamily LD-carboxypeptidase LdcB
MSLSTDQLTGISDQHVTLFEGSVYLQRACIAAFIELRQEAAAAGFDLRIASGFRSFERQLLIWNGKANGERPVHDDAGLPLDLAALDPVEQVHRILRFSALPGGSRHHWGTDMDVYDAAAMAADYRLQLSPQEAADEGVFGPLHRWLDERIAAGQAADFYRPYARDRGGVAPERWHLSYAPLARPCSVQLTPELLAQVLSGAALARGDVVLARLPEICRRFCG